MELDVFPRGLGMRFTAALRVALQPRALLSIGTIARSQRRRQRKLQERGRDIIYCIRETISCWSSSPGTRRGPALQEISTGRSARTEHKAGVCCCGRARDGFPRVLFSFSTSGQFKRCPRRISALRTARHVFRCPWRYLVGVVFFFSP